MEILGKIGIDVKLLAAQIVNFGLLLWILKRFLYKPILERIEKDEKELNEALAEKESLEKDKDAFVEQQKKESGEAHDEAKKIIAEAEEISEKIKEKAQKEAEKEKEATIKQIHSRLKELEDAKKE